MDRRGVYSRCARLLALATLLSGCGDSTHPFLCDGGTCGTQVSSKKNYQSSFNSNVDFLFVVDDTVAMEPQLGALATGFAGMAQRLAESRDPTSIHVGFVRAGGCDTSTRAGACDVNAPEQFLRAEWCRTTTNFGGPFTSTFSCLADLGAANCGPAQPLAAATELLAGTGRAGWEGFLRLDAYLVIVIASASDDVSGTPVADLTARLKSLKADPTEVLVSVIGPGDCAAGDVPGPRLTEFATAFGANGNYLGLCSGTLPAALDRSIQYVGRIVDPACLSNVRDSDPEQPGLQATCSVVDTVSDPRTGTRTITALPNCDQGAPPCWRLVSNGTCAIFDIDRGADWCGEAVVSGTIECLGCASSTDPACAQTR